MYNLCVCVCVLCVSSDARLKVLDIMDQCQGAPRPELKENGPAYGMLSSACDYRLQHHFALFRSLILTHTHLPPHTHTHGGRMHLQTCTRTHTLHIYAHTHPHQPLSRSPRRRGGGWLDRGATGSGPWSQRLGLRSGRSVRIRCQCLPRPERSWRTSWRGWRPYCRRRRRLR